MNMHMALGALFALIGTTVSAQKDEPFKDTITISPTKDFTIMFIGHDMNKMVEKNRFDSLKLFFVSDMEQASSQSAYPPNTKLTYYFVAANGKRRLKAESEDYQAPIDIEKEKQSLQAGLPAYQYVIIDMPNDCQYSIYVPAETTTDQEYQL